MHYSILPVYEPPENEKQPIYTELSYKGVNLLVCETEGGQVVERIYSTNPQDFLNPIISPGVVLENTCE